MLEEINFEIETATESMEAALSHLNKELLNVRAGKAHPSMLNGVYVEYYGSSTPINQTATVSILDARTLSIQPWEKSMLQLIEKAIFAANLGVTPQNDGKVIRISVPPLTQERRKGLVKQVKKLGEDARISIRSARRDGISAMKQLVKDGLSEDQGKDAETNIQDLTNRFNRRVDALVQAKEKDLLSM